MTRAHTPIPLSGPYANIEVYVYAAVREDVEGHVTVIVGVGDLLALNYYVDVPGGVVYPPSQLWLGGPAVTWGSGSENEDTVNIAVFRAAQRELDRPTEQRGFAFLPAAC